MRAKTPSLTSGGWSAASAKTLMETPPLSTFPPACSRRTRQAIRSSTRPSACLRLASRRSFSSPARRAPGSPPPVNKRTKPGLTQFARAWGFLSGRFSRPLFCYFQTGPGWLKHLVYCVYGNHACGRYPPGPADRGPHHLVDGDRNGGLGPGGDRRGQHPFDRLWDRQPDRAGERRYFAVAAAGGKPGRRRRTRGAGRRPRHLGGGGHAGAAVHLRAGHGDLWVCSPACNRRARRWGSRSPRRPF